ncbi:MAG TPA: LysM peptidoglycan-binding domain-containing protein [Cryomorphaceae bacterium]|nr:LysM peptidoglycan-binding domain-containing protein [Cryomorphaceae bacterium]
MTPKQTPFSIAFFLFLFWSFGAMAQEDQNANQPETDTIEVKILPDDPVLQVIDQMWQEERLGWQCFEADSICLNKYGFAYGEVPSYPDSVISQRLAELNKLTPLDLDYNNYVKAYIEVYTERKRGVTTRVLGLAELYYPLFEEKLDQFDIPLELKHLAVVESALNASARSWVGASGLWQFMYTTGKIYNLEVTSYIDERSDPYASTVAACRYMKKLYSMYGDWNLVLAAYNSGPGNVNKAIRRSGGHRDYWKIRPYLPRETRGYVPAFIAVNYVMNYAPEHNLYPTVPTHLYAEIDTVHVCREARFDQISLFTGVSVEELEILNPALKKNIIPETPTCQVLYLPRDVVGTYLANEDSLLNYKPEQPQAVDGFVEEEIVEHYTVRRGDVLGLIAQRHGVGVSQLREWNYIRGNTIHPGQKLEIKKVKRTKVGESASQKAEEKSTAKSDKAAPKEATASSSFHVVQRGDTLWDIAKKYPGISATDIKKANSGINSGRLRPGQKLKIPN